MVYGLQLQTEWRSEDKKKKCQGKLSKGYTYNNNYY